MHKISTFLRYFIDFLQFGQVRLVLASIFYIITKKSFIETRIFRGKLGYFLHRKGSLDFQFGNYAYEWNVKKVMLKHYKSYNVFLDIGSNIGTYAIMLGQKGLKVFAFEPIYNNHKALTINILLNNLEDHVTAFNFGLSDEASTASFSFDPLNTGASHIASLPAETPEAEQRSIKTEIKLSRLDDILPLMRLTQEDKILVKIDVEGMELEVLGGSIQFLKQYPHLMIIMESVHSGEQKLREMLDQIAEFEYFTIDNLNMGAIKKGNLKN